MVSITGDTVTGKRIARDRGRHRQAAPPRARRQGADHRLRRRRRRPRGRDAAVRRLLELRPGLHRGDARHRRPGGLRQVRLGAGRPGPDHQVGRPGRGRRHRDGLADRAGPGRQGPGHGRPCARRRRGRRRWRAAGPAGAYYAPTVIAGPGPEVRDHPGRDLRAGRHGPAVQRRGPGGRRGRTTRPTGSRHRSSRATSARRCASPRPSSSATSGSTSTSRSTSETPHGGVKQSGWGKDGSKYALEDYTFVKHVMINTGV